MQIGGCRSLWKMTSQVASKTDEAADTLCGSPCRDDRLVVGWPLPDCGTQYLPHSWWDGDTVCNRCAAKPTRTTGCCYQVKHGMARVVIGIPIPYEVRRTQLQVCTRYDVLLLMYPDEYYIGNQPGSSAPCRLCCPDDYLTPHR